METFVNDINNNLNELNNTDITNTESNANESNANEVNTEVNKNDVNTSELKNEERKILVHDNDFNNLVILKGKIEGVDFLDPLYASKVMKLDLFKIATFNSKNFMEMIGELLEIDSYKINKLKVKKEFIGDELNYAYEMLYVDLKDHVDFHTDENKNEFATILNNNGDTIYSNAIIVKNYIPSLSDEMTLHSVSKKDIERLLYHRVYTKIATFDTFENYWREDIVNGDMTVYAEKYFEGEQFLKLEFAFLLHNVNIWYTSDYGLYDVCGKLVSDRIDKCIIFSMRSEEYRGNITIDEINKIIKLSNILKSYNVPAEEKEDRYDEHGRRIINTRYKILDKIYQNYFKEIC